jgi:phosphoserine phosphatase
MINKKIRVAFDVDGTLIDICQDVPKYDNIALFKHFERLDCDMFIWSGGGIDYAQHWMNKLGLEATIINKEESINFIDICFDDEVVNLAKINIQV